MSVYATCVYVSVVNSCCLLIHPIRFCTRVCICVSINFVVLYLITRLTYVPFISAVNPILLLLILAVFQEAVVLCVSFKQNHLLQWNLCIVVTLGPTFYGCIIEVRNTLAICALGPSKVALLV